MKHIIIVGMALLFAFSTAYAQTKAPQAVTTAFQQKFPTAKTVKWDKENAHEYEGSFELNGKKYSANFTDTGKWLETETETKYSELPEVVKQSFEKTYGKQIKTTAAKIEKVNGTVEYEVEFKNKEAHFYTNGNEFHENTNK